MLQLLKEAGYYSASRDSLHSKLFGEKPGGLRLNWEYSNMMLFDFGGDDFLANYKEEFDGFKRLMENFLHQIQYITNDSYYEEINALQAQKAKIDANNILNEEIEKPKEAENEIDIDGFENLPKLFIKPTEKLMDEFTGSVKSCRGLFKIPKTNVPTGNLHQQI